MEVVAGVVPDPGTSKLTALKSRKSPATSKCTWCPLGLKSNAVFKMMSGLTLGTFGFVTDVATLVSPLFVSHCAAAPTADAYPAFTPGGSATDEGQVCCGFSRDTPIAQLFVGWRITRNDV